MKKEKGFFIIEERDNGYIIWNGFPVEKLGGYKLKIIEDVYNVSDNLQNVFTNTSNIPLKKLKDKDKQRCYNILESPNFENYKAIRGETKSTRCKYCKSNFENRVKKSFLEDQRIEKVILPSNGIDIYTRLEILLGLNLSGHTDTLTEASNLVDQLYKKGEIQNEQQYGNALDKFST